jgi:hypothetical protein
MTACIGLLVAAGCGKSDWGYLSGAVLLNGQPVGPGTITFERVDQQRSGAIATFGEDGRYSVVSAGRKDGAPTGEYRVAIIGGENFGEEGATPAKKSKIPARYSNPDTSKQTVTIESGQKSFDFQLEP